MIERCKSNVVFSEVVECAAVTSEGLFLNPSSVWGGLLFLTDRTRKLAVISISCTSKDSYFFPISRTSSRLDITIPEQGSRLIISQYLFKHRSTCKLGVPDSRFRVVQMCKLSPALLVGCTLRAEVVPGGRPMTFCNLHCRQ